MNALWAMTLAALLVGANADEVERANRLFAEGKFAEAAEIYRRVQADVPASPIPALNLGAASLKAGKVDEATTAFKKASEASDAAVRGRAAYGLGNCLAKTGDLQNALASFKQAIEQMPDDEDAKWNYESVKRRLDEQKKQQNQENSDQQKDDDKKSDDSKQPDEKKNDEQQKPDETSDKNDAKPDEQKQDEKQDHGEKKDEPSTEDSTKDNETKSEKNPDKQDQKDKKNQEGQTPPAKPDDEKQAEAGDQKPGAEDPNQSKIDLSKSQIEQLLESLKQDEKTQRKQVRRAVAVPRGEPKKDW